MSDPAPKIAAGGTPWDLRGAALASLFILVSILILQSAQQVLIPIVLAVLVSYVLTPVVSRLARLRVPRTVGAGVALALLVAALAAAVWAVSDDALRLVDDLPRAARQMRDTLRQRRLGADESALRKVQEAASELERTAAEAARAPRAPSGVLRVQIVEPAFRAANYLWWGSMGLVGFAGELTMILFLVYFLLASADTYKQKLIRLGGQVLGRRNVTADIIDDINTQIQRYLVMLVITSAVVAAATSAALWALGVREWLFWGLVSGVLNTIPYFGPVIVSGALFVIAYLQFNAFGQAAAVSLAALAITSLEGWLLTPVLMGRAARMNPVAVFVGLLFWGWVWGGWGVILAVPMMMMLKAVCDRVEDLQPVAELLGE